MCTATTTLKLAVLLLVGAVAALPTFGQTQPTPPAESGRTYQSPDGAFSIAVPAGWKTRQEEGSNEVTFLSGYISVSVSVAATEPGDTVEKWLDINKSSLEQQCPNAEIREEGKTTVAGFPGAFFSMFCPGPRLPTIVRIAVAIRNGQFLIFNVTSPSAQLAAAQPDIDRMALSFHPASGQPQGKEIQNNVR